MTDDLEVPLGTPSKLAYLIRMEEDTWLRYSEDDRKACKDLWHDEAVRCAAEPDNDIRIICLLLIPDPIFPSTDKEKPYVEWQQLLNEKDPDHFEAEVVITLESACYSEIDPQLRIALTKALSAYPMDSKYAIKLDTGEVLDRGRIT